MSLISGLSAGLSVFKTAVELRDDTKIATATNDLMAKLAVVGANLIGMQEKVAAATDQATALRADLRRAEERIAEFERRKSEREKYELIEPFTGTFALRIKKAVQGAEPMHYICAACMDNRFMKSIIQFNGGSRTIGTCNECKTNFRFGESQFKSRNLRVAG
jgi:hypothetical protein